MKKRRMLQLLMLPALLLAFLAFSEFVNVPSTHAQSARIADDPADGDSTGSYSGNKTMACKTAHVEFIKRNGPSNNNVVARYIMNKHFCFDGTNVVSSDAADVRGYVVSGLSLIYEFKGNISVQNGSSVNGSSTAQGNFAIKADVTIPLPLPFKINNLGNWQPSLTISPHGDGGFDYAPSSGVNSGPNDIVKASSI